MLLSRNSLGCVGLSWFYCICPWQWSGLFSALYKLDAVWPASLLALVLCLCAGGHSSRTEPAHCPLLALTLSGETVLRLCSSVHDGLKMITFYVPCSAVPQQYKLPMDHSCAYGETSLCMICVCFINCNFSRLLCCHTNSHHLVNFHQSEQMVNLRIETILTRQKGMSV